MDMDGELAGGGGGGEGAGRGSGGGVQQLIKPCGCISNGCVIVKFGVGSVRGGRWLGTLTCARAGDIKKK